MRYKALKFLHPVSTDAAGLWGNGKKNKPQDERRVVPPIPAGATFDVVRIEKVWNDVWGVINEHVRVLLQRGQTVFACWLKISRRRMRLSARSSPPCL